MDEPGYIQALERDLQQDIPHAQGRRLTSIFFGGGTPSLFSPQSIEKILVMAEKYLGFEQNIEITLEANPGTAEQEKFKGFYHAGVNRLSIGIQSFQAKHLSVLERIHSAAEATRALEFAREAGFKNVNIDLMHGLPNQSVDNALSDLEQAFQLQPQHLSWYQLTIEPNTRFYSQPPLLPKDEYLADIQQAGQEKLDQAGYRQYEVSAYCQDNLKSQHNLNYWTFGDYLGVGAGAHSKVTNSSTGFIYRFHKTRQPQNYLNAKGAYISKKVTLENAELPLEFMMNALRLTNGIPAALFSQRTGLPYSTIKPIIERLVAQELLMPSEHHIQTTSLGQQFLNTLLTEFMVN